MTKKYQIFNRNYKQGEIIKCECGNEVFICVEDTKSGEPLWNRFFNFLNGHNFKEGQIHCYCNKCGVEFEWFVHKGSDVL